MHLLSTILGIFLGNLIGFSIILSIMYFINKKIIAKKLETFIRGKKLFMKMAKIIGNPITKRIK